MKVATYLQIEVNELERLVKETYGVTYEFRACEEWNNAYYTFHIENNGDPIKKLDLYDREKWDEFLSGNMPMWIARDIIADLIFRGIIQGTDILVDATW